MIAFWGVGRLLSGERSQNTCPGDTGALLTTDGVLGFAVAFLKKLMPPPFPFEPNAPRNTRFV
jgi:hypothetical protein